MLLAAGAGFSAPMLPVDENTLFKAKNQWAFEGQLFRISSRANESVLLYAVRNRRFLSDHFYWGEAGAGALAGIHGGYFEGGGSVGYQREFLGAMLAEAHVFSGAGGGGGVREGGGWLVHYVAGLGVAWNPRLQTVVQGGYKFFLNADIRSWTTGVSLNYSFWEIQ
jgi:hypothetical protein